MRDDRPIFVNPLKVQLPVTALVSILHRISGVVLIVLSPVLMWCLAKILQGPQGHMRLHGLLQHGFFVFVLWGALVALGYHVLAGLRHVLMDMGMGESLRSARLSAAILLLLAVLFAVYVGMRLC